MKLNRKLRYGMVGGGPGAFIGEVHRKAASLDYGIELVAGAFSIVPEESIQMGKELNLDSKRVYRDYEEMIEKEKNLPEDQRIDFVSITTPNNWHFPIARDFLKAGFHVLCEKPMTINSEEAKELKKIVDETGLFNILKVGWQRLWNRLVICRLLGELIPNKAVVQVVWVILEHMLKIWQNILQV